MTLAHRCETICRRTAEKIEQDGLCLVVGCVAGGGTFRQGSEPRRTRSRFEVGPGGDDHLVDDDFDTESRGELVDDMYVLVGTFAQAMVDVMDDHVTSGGNSKHQEC
jgi:hypothetical protein